MGAVPECGAEPEVGKRLNDGDLGLPEGINSKLPPNVIFREKKEARAFSLCIPGHGELAGVAAHLCGVVVVGDVGCVVAGLVDDEAVGLRGDVVLVVGGHGDSAAPLVLLEAVVLEEVDHARPRNVLHLEWHFSVQALL